MKRIISTIAIIIGIVALSYAGSNPTISLPVLNNQTPGPGLLVPLNVNFSTAPSGVGSFSLDIQFNPKVMTFTAINNPALADIEASVVSGNKVRLFWYGTSTNLNGKLLDLNFTYHGDNSALTFALAQNEVSDPNGNVLSVSYTNGAVNMVTLVPALTISEVQANMGQVVNVPVTVSAFYNVAGFLLNIEFENPSAIQGTVSIQNVNAGLGGSISSNFVNGNKLSVSWTANLGGNNISLANGQKLFDLRFTFNGGSSDIAFGSGSELNQNIPPIFPAFPSVIYTDGLITDGIQYFDLNLQASPGNIGATLSGTGTYAVGQSVNISTTVPSGYNFTAWTGAQTNLLADATNSSTSFVMPANNVIFTANFTQVFSVSGVLKYANTSGAARPITNSTVYLKTADGLSTIATATTNETGVYTFENVPAGSYKLTASTTKPWSILAVTLADYAIVRNFVNTSTPNLVGIILSAANVNNSGGVTLADYAIIKNRVNNPSALPWASPDWIFESINIAVTNASLANIIITGILSGDVNTSYQFE